jgi:hypothetical protein
VKHIYFELFEAGVGENEAINPTHLQDVWSGKEWFPIPMGYKFWKFVLSSNYHKIMEYR